MLAEMKEKWSDINFHLKPFKNVSSIISGWDEINVVLDEHIINT